jgi:UDP-N-acetylglucosamine/UDP-N-acetylgalactosamine diphosphorylase
LVAFEIVREEEFSPLKNASGVGKDCPETCRRDLYRLHKRFITQAGGVILDGARGDGSPSTELADEVEISPLVSYAGEGLEGVKDKTFAVPFFVDEATASGQQHSS